MNEGERKEGEKSHQTFATDVRSQCLLKSPFCEFTFINYKGVGTMLSAMANIQKFSLLFFRLNDHNLS